MTLHSRGLAVLWQIMKITREKKISIDPLTTIPYAVRLLLAHDMRPEEIDRTVDTIMESLRKESAESSKPGFLCTFFSPSLFLSLSLSLSLPQPLSPPNQPISKDRLSWPCSLGRHTP